MAQSSPQSARCRPHAYLALRRQRSTEQVHRLLRNRQPQSGTFRLLALPLHLTELIEDVPQVFGRDIDARVSNGQLGIAIDASQRQCDDPSVPHRSDGAVSMTRM